MNTAKDTLKGNTIPREVAKRKFRNWIEYATGKLGFTPQNVPKSIHVPIVDINNLLKTFKIYDKREVSGIRIYFIRDESYKIQPDGLYLKCMVVPTVQGNSGMPNDHEDAIIKIPALESHNRSGTAALAKGSGGSGETETIYDFTTSCPPDCNGTGDFK